MRRGATVLAAAVVFAFLMAGNLVAKDSPKGAAEKIVLQVEGMTCTGCEAKVERALQKIEGVQSVDADYKTGKVVVQVKGKVDKEALRKAVDKTGFKVVDKPGMGGTKAKHKDCKGDGCCGKGKSKSKSCG
ncbi:MAG: heavy-metal-associated domain-containing protein [Calditrichaeota bacterium]|nr:heavy-metal-associated domain-containing protein [Calditrichota bacterium]